jgi:integrase
MAERRERGLKQLPDGRWRWSFKDPNGKYHRKIARTKSEARAYLEKVRTEIREDRYLNRRKEMKGTFEEACKKFLEWGEVNLAKSTSSQDASFVRRWKASPHFKGKMLNKISVADVEAYKAALRAEIGPRQTDYILSRLRRMFNLSIRTWELCEKNPISGGKVKFFNVKARRDRYVTPEEEAKILESAVPRLRPAIIFSIHTGLRQDELLSLTWSEVNLNVGRHGEIKVRGDIAKDREDRHIPLSATARSVLDSFPHPHRQDVRVFSGLGSSRENLNGMWYRALDISGINEDVPRVQRITWHTLRHTFASRLVMAGVDLATVQKLMGHSSITTTMRYAHLARPHIEDSVLVLDPKLQSSCTHSETVLERRRNDSQAG